MEGEEKEIKIVKPTKEIRSKRLIFLSRIRRRLARHVLLMRVALATFFLALFVLILFGVLSFFNFFGFAKYVHLASSFIRADTSKVESTGGRTNILILGKGGAGHEAPDLTDTIIFASVSHKDGGVSFISLPRDIWIDELRAKLNSIYYWGNQRSVGGGLILSKATVEEIMGLPIHYAVIVDFSQLKGVIDILGGVNVDVERAFVDEKYPIAGLEADTCNGDKTFGCRYETIRFEQGLQLMDGEIALKFVRSRTAQGDEGTDLARSARQQKVIDAIQNKLISRDTIFSLSKIKALVSLFETTVESDMSEDAMAVVARRVVDARDNKSSYVLGEEFLDNPPTSKKYDNLYVFVPKGGNWNQVQDWIRKILK